MKCVLIHGLGQTAQSWNETAAAMERCGGRSDVMCPDLTELLGNKKPCWDELYGSFEEYCLGIGEPLELCGLSLGGILALRFCAEHSDKVSGAVLIGAQFVMPRNLLRLQNAVFHLMPKSAFVSTGFGKKEFLSLARSMETLDFSEDLERITCPTLIICGEKDKPNRKAAIRMNAGIKGSELLIVAGSGHEVNVDRPDELGKAISVFFGKKCS